MKFWLRCVATGALVSLLGVGLQSAKADPVSDLCRTFNVDITRMENLSTETSLLTQFPGEARSATAFGFAAAPDLAFRASLLADTDVWRMYNSRTRDFTWAVEGDDLDNLTDRGYARQFAQFTAASVGNKCLAAAHRLVKGDVSRIVVGDAERDEAVREGWQLSSSGMFFAAAVGSIPSAPEVPGGEPPVEEADKEEFTIAVIPDTQQETWSDVDLRFRHRSEWLVENAKAENLKFVTHAGDVVDWGDVSPAQYTRAKAGLSPLDGKIPYSLTVGNHDTAAVCQGGAACPGRSAAVDVRNTAAFNAAFNAGQFTNMRGQYEAGKVDNAFSTFEAGGEKWMVLNLELWPRRGAIDWAKTVVAGHSDHNVIVATHSYLNSDGSIGQSNGGYGATSPQMLFDSLIKVYPNIKMVVSGHTGTSASRIDTGENGNKILSLLQCFHSRTTNPVRLVKINPATGAVTHRIYAPFTNETLQDEEVVSGFDFDL